MNPHEEAARARKVTLLVAEIDRDLSACGMDLAKEASTVLAIVKTIGEDAWRETAREAGCNAPSKETQRQVIAIFERRVHGASANAKGAA